MEQNLLRVRTPECVRAALCALFLALYFLFANAQIVLAEETKLQIPARPASATAPAKAPPYREDVLLVMPQRGADPNEITDIFKEMRGQLIETIGEGELTCYVIKVEKGKMLECEKKLLQDKHFSAVQRDYVFQANQSAVNDPYFSSEWHLSALNVVRGWTYGQGSGAIIGVLDTGTNYGISELSGKVYSGYDAVLNRNGQSDVQGHGTMVATTAAALTNNRVGTAAPARLSYVYPIRIGDSNGSISSTALLKGIQQAGNAGIRIINISANGEPPYSFSNRSVYSALHTYFRWFHDTKNGLIFVSAGNSPVRDSNPILPYLVVVSAINPSYSLASFSTYGPNLWFTAPGQSIYCTTRDGRVASVAGTSFSSPLVAAVAAMVLGANPSLRNTQVESILRSTCYKAGTASRTEWYGYGMPNAEAALRMATGR